MITKRDHLLRGSCFCEKYRCFMYQIVYCIGRLYSIHSVDSDTRVCSLFSVQYRSDRISWLMAVSPMSHTGVVQTTP